MEHTKMGNIAYNDLARSVEELEVLYKHTKKMLKIAKLRKNNKVDTPRDETESQRAIKENNMPIVHDVNTNQRDKNVAVISHILNESKYNVSKAEIALLSVKSIDQLDDMIRVRESQFKKEFNYDTAWKNREQRKKRPAFVLAAEDAHMKLSKWIDAVVVAKYNEFDTNHQLEKIKRRWLSSNDARRDYLCSVFTFEKVEGTFNGEERCAPEEKEEVERREPLPLTIDAVFEYLIKVERSFKKQYEFRITGRALDDAIKKIDRITTDINEILNVFGTRFTNSDNHQNLKARLRDFSSMLINYINSL